jgi:hypothetical protein
LRRIAPVSDEGRTFSIAGRRNATMTAPYRDDTDSLEARHSELAEELSSVQARTRELDGLKASEARLASEVAEVAKKLEARRARRALPLLDSVKIASPCTASWDEMIGDERARFCTHCQKDVFNLSALPRDEAESFVRERAGDACIRLYKRADGTVLTSDCPVGVTRQRRRKIAVAAVAAFSSALMTAGMFLRLAPVRPSERDGMMGKMEAEYPATPAETAAPPPQHVMGAMPMMPAKAVPPSPTPKKAPAATPSFLNPKR